MNKLFFLLSILLILTNACKKLERINPKDGIAGITTSEAKQLDLSTLQISSSLTTIEGVAYVTQRGICWSTSPNPTTNDNFTNEGSGFGTFESKISGLSANTTYYFRAFASNNKTTTYGNEVSFKFNEIKPIITTNLIINITKVSATSGGTVISDGGSPITVKGICWSTNTNPTITDSKTSDGTGSGNFISKLTGLKIGTKYYVRAYATNTNGTSYGNEISFQSLFIDGLGQMLSDVDGNTYKTVYIGSQLWMAENLKVTKYNDGTVIPNITDNTQWSNLINDNTQWSNLTSGAWAYYNNDAANNAKYGKLYNWFAVSPTTNGTKNVCPTGWHVPTDAEWSVLTDYLGGANVAGGKMKEVGTTNWNSPNTGATNTSLFSALPGGYRMESGYYVYIGSYGYWWSSSEINTLHAWNRSLLNEVGITSRNNFLKNFGFSVRCLRD